MPHWQELGSRKEATFIATLFRADDTKSIGVIIEQLERVLGAVVFPVELSAYGISRYEQLHTECDVEDLLREWSNESDYERLLLKSANEASHEP